MRRLAAVTLIVLLTSCASRADRITEALENQGLGPRQSRCMGERLADRLDTQQLLRLREIGKAARPANARKLSLDGLLDQLNREGDPKLVSTVVKAGLHCAI